MPKSLSSLWLKSMRRMGKAQEAQGRNLLKSFLPKPAQTAKSPRAPRVKAVVWPKLTLVTLAKPLKIPNAAAAVRKVKAPSLLKTPTATPTARKTAVSDTAEARAAGGLAGSWRKTWFSMPGGNASASPRRMLYWLYLPASAAANPDKPAGLPLVVMLHGCQQTAAEIATATRMNALAERKGFAVLYPQQSAAGDAHRCWHWYQRATQQGQGDVALIAAMVAQVQARYGLDASRTYVAGLSAGAGLAAILGLRHPDLFAAVGLHSAPVFGTSDSAMSAYRAMQHGAGSSYSQAAHEITHAAPGFPGMPAIVIHGSRDSVVRAVNADQLSVQFQIVNERVISGTAEPVQRDYPGRRGGRKPRHGYQTTTWYAGRKPQLVKCDIDGLDHAWSGGDGGVPFSAPEGPDATLMMWSFFALHRRRPAALPAGK